MLASQPGTATAFVGLIRPIDDSELVTMSLSHVNSHFDISITALGPFAPASGAVRLHLVTSSIASLPVYSAVAVRRFAYAAYSYVHAPRSVHLAEHRFSTVGAAVPVVKAQSYPADVVFLTERIQSAAAVLQAAQQLPPVSFLRSGS